MIHLLISKRGLNAMIIQDGAEQHNVVGLVILAVNDKLSQFVLQGPDNGLAPRSGFCGLHVVGPLLPEEWFPIVKCMVGETMVAKPFAYQVGGDLSVSGLGREDLRTS